MSEFSEGKREHFLIIIEKHSLYYTKGGPTIQRIQRIYTFEICCRHVIVVCCRLVFVVC